MTNREAFMFLFVFAAGILCGVLLMLACGLLVLSCR